MIWEIIMPGGPRRRRGRKQALNELFLWLSVLQKAALAGRAACSGP